MKMPDDDRAGSVDALQSQARVWLRLLTSAEVKAYDTEGFQRWLRSSACAPRRRSARPGDAGMHSNQHQGIPASAPQSS
ncbi:hypothetical protein ACU4GD_31865 [Cupriavidus basilensis]